MIIKTDIINTFKRMMIRDNIQSTKDLPTDFNIEKKLS